MSGLKHINPPSLPQRFLQWFCKPELLEMIEGDLEEEFYNKAEQSSIKAKWYYTIEVIRFFKPFAIKKIFKNKSGIMGMNANYLKVAIRGFKNDKTNMVLSLVGLIVALTCAMVIYTIVNYQLSYDGFHEKSDRIFRINYDETKNPRSDRILPTVGPPLGPAIKEFFPEVEASVRFRYTPNQIVTYRDNQFYEEKIFYVDPSVLTVFSYPLAKGNPENALDKKNSIILTAPMAKKYFGNDNPIGKILDVGEIPLEVTGVFEEIPSNTHFPFDFIRPFDAFEVPYGYPVTLDDWGWISFHTYVLLKEGADYKALEAKLPEFAKTHFEEERLNAFDYKLQPLNEIYFSGIHTEVHKVGNYSYVYVLSCVGILLLVLAAFNFTNISTAKSLTRALETGVRKAMGSSKNALWWRYLLEPLVLTLLSVVVGLLLLPFLLEQAQASLGVEYLLTNELYIEVALLFVPLALFIGFVSGIYPAFIMSSFNPSTVLKGSMKTGQKGSVLRTTLVTVQFAITSALLIGSFIISSQINFMLNKDLGFDKEELAVLQMPGEVLQRYFEPLKTKLMQNPNVSGVTMAGGRLDGDTGSGPIAMEGVDEPVPMAINAIGDDFFKIIGVKVLAGKEFSNTNEYDSAHGVIINESVAKVFNLTPEEAIGKQIRVSGQREGTVMGVVENFHFTSLHDQIQPLVLIYPHTRLRNIYMRVEAGNLHDVIVSIENDWKEVVPEVPFDLVMLNDHLQSLYKNDMQFAGMVKFFSWVTIIIAIVGLYGLITLICKYRMKEVGIRKVLGASVGSLIVTLSKSFTLFILIANIITWPIVYYFADNWIDSFAYKISLSPLYFVLGLVITLFIAGVTLVIQSGKAALVNPVKTLRQE
ncbi:ABC transporter permease [Fulvivirga lutea]|uniref:ABC transporter permease n=1 Tax=Fulvivirga lutea TaxID=2810512 RepID=A0A975A0X5_9BACT|nr:ABC transporter permease [Fulvivirga lutea]QSE96927.1 ABC transporter permease [Fulvivirga lutea]